MRQHGGWLRVTLLVVVALGCAATLNSSIAAAQATPAASPSAAGGGVGPAIQWLLGQQAEDGGFIGFEGESDPGLTSDAIIAMVAAREVGASVDTDQAVARAVEFLETTSADYAESGAGQAAKLALAAMAVGADPTDLGGSDLLASIEDDLDEETGIYGTGVFDHALAMLALRAAGRDVAAPALDALIKRAGPEGGWAFDGNPEPAALDSNTTALVLQALVAVGFGDNALLAAGLDFLRTAQEDDGAFRFQPSEGFPADANSTGLVVQGLIAVGEDPASESWNNASGALAAFQNQSGAFRYSMDQPEDNIFATVQAIPALVGLAQPILPAGYVPATPAATPVARVERSLAA